MGADPDGRAGRSGGGRSGGGTPGGGPGKQQAASPNQGIGSLTKPNLTSPLYNPNQTLSGKSLYQAGQSLAQSEYGPTISEDRAQIAQNNRQGAAAQKLTAGYFNQLGRFTQRGLAAQRGIAGGLNSQLAQIGGQTAGTLDQVGQGAMSGLARYTPTPTAGDQSLRAPGMESLTQQLALQKSLNAQDTAAFRSAGAMQGANFRSLAASNLGTEGLWGQQSLGQIAEGARLANMPLTSQIAADRSKMGALAAADTAKLRETEITNALTRWGLGQKGKALQITAAQNQAQNALALRQQNINAAHYQQEAKQGWARLNIEQQNNLANQAWHSAEINLKRSQGSGQGGVKPLTTSENNTMQSLLDTTAAALKGGANPSALETGTAAYTPKGSHAHHYLPRTPAPIVTAAQELNSQGWISAQTAQVLKNMGLRNLTYNGKPIQVRQAGFTG